MNQSKPTKATMRKTGLTVLGLIVGAVAVAAVLWQKAHPETWAVSYGAVNHTDKSIVAIALNGEGGILNIGPYGAGNAGVCCVIVPQRWRDGLEVKVQWREAGTFKLDAQGNEVHVSGVPVLIEAPWRSQTVPLPRYDKSGDLYVFFFPGDVVKVALTSSPEWDGWYEPTEEDLKHGNRVKRNYGTTP